MPQPIKAHRLTYNVGGQEVTLASSHKVQSMITDLEGNLNNLSEQLKNRFKKLVVSQLSLIPYQDKDYNIKSVNVQANVADMQQATIDNLHECPGRKPVKHLVDDIQKKENSKTKYEESVDVKKAKHKTSPANGRCSIRKDAESSTDKGSNDKRTDKIRPPVAPRTKKSNNRYSTSNRNLSSDLNSATGDSSYSDKTKYQESSQRSRQIRTLNNFQDAQMKNVQKNDSYIPNIRISEDSTDGSLIAVDRFDADLEAEGSETKSQISPGNDVNKLVNAKAIERRKKARDLLKSGQLCLENGKDTENSQTPQTTKSSEKWQTLRNHLKSGKLMLEGKMPNEIEKCKDVDNKTLRTTSAERWKKLGEQLRLRKALLVNEMSNEDSYTINKQMSHEPHESVNPPRHDLRSDQKLFEPEMSVEDNQVTFPMASKSKTLRECLKSGQIFLDNVERETSTNDNADQKPGTSKTSSRWKKLRERLHSRRALLENDISLATGLSPKVTQSIQNTDNDSDAGSENTEQQSENVDRPMETNAKPYATLPRINGLLVMLAKLVEESSKGNTGHELWNDALDELSALEEEVAGQPSTSTISDAKMEMDRAETGLCDKLNKLISTEKRRTFSLDDDVEQFKRTAIAHGAADSDETVLVELRELLLHLYSLSCLLPEYCTRNRPEQKDQECQTDTEHLFDTIISTIAKPLYCLRRFVSTKRGAPLRKSTQVNEETAHIYRLNDSPASSLPAAPVDANGSIDLRELMTQESVDTNTPTLADRDLGIVRNTNEAANWKQTLRVKQKLFIRCFIGKSWTVPRAGNPYTCRFVVRALVGAACVGMLVSVLFASDFIGAVVAAWM